MFNQAKPAMASQGNTETRLGFESGQFPACRPGTAHLVEAGGRYLHGFRRGPDYAFTRACCRARPGAERVIRLSMLSSRILVPAQAMAPSAGL